MSAPQNPRIHVTENNLARYRKKFAESWGKTQQKQSRRKNEHSLDFNLSKKCCEGDIQRGKAIKWRSKKCHDRPP